MNKRVLCPKPQLNFKILRAVQIKSELLKKEQFRAWRHFVGIWSCTLAGHNVCCKRTAGIMCACPDTTKYNFPCISNTKQLGLKLNWLGSGWYFLARVSGYGWTAEPRQPYSLSTEQKYAINTLSTRSKENLQAFWDGHLKLKMGFQRVFAQHQIHVFSLFSALR
jgi:hypothetical protein